MSQNDRFVTGGGIMKKNTQAGNYEYRKNEKTDFYRGGYRPPEEYLAGPDLLDSGK